MSCSTNDDDNKKSSGLFITKITEKPPKETGLPIFNINNLTDGELKILIQNFFENDDGYEDSNKYNNKKCIYLFFFECKLYKIILIGEKDDAKKSLIKFLNFLKNITIDGFHCMPYDFDNDVDIIKLVGEVIKNSRVIKYVAFTNNLFKNYHVFEILHIYLKKHTSLRDLYFGDTSIDKLSKKNIGLLIDVIKSSTIEYISGLHKDDYYIVFEDLMNNFFLSKNPKIECAGKSLNDDLILKLSNMIIDNNINYL